MAGTKEGARKTKERNLANDPDFYKKIGAKGGKALTGNKGFALMDKNRLKEISSRAGKVSGRIRRKRKTLGKEVTGEYIDIPLEER